MECILLIIGLVSGVVGSLLGLGGGIIIVPTLLEMSALFPKLSQVTPAVAVGTSLVLVFLGSLSATSAALRQKRINFRKGISLFLGTSPGSFVGSYLTAYVQSKLFYVAFAIMILLMLLMLEVKKKVSSELPTQNLPYVLVFAISFIVGMLSGLFGIGGGVFLVPFMYFLGFPLHVATATSIFSIFLSSLVGGTTHFFLKDIHWYAVWFLGPGIIMGGFLGAWLSPRIKTRVLLIVLRLVLVCIGLNFLYKGLV